MRFVVAILFFMSGVVQFNAQEVPSSPYIETEAVITEINFKIQSRRSVSTAKVAYVTKEGDSLESSVRLPHIPFLGNWYDKGDTITVLYDAERPLLLKTKGGMFTESYGIYLVIGIVVLVYVYRRMKNRRKT